MATQVHELIRLFDELFSKAGGRNDLWQTIAENFYVERANFTHDRTEGEEFAGHLFGSFPAIVRRELGNLFSSILRPRSLKWFALHVTNERLDKELAVREYLEHVDGVQWRAMYDPAARFVQATKEADHDFASFGNAVIEVGLSRDRSSLLHRAHHLRDCVWSENADGKIDTLYRRWNPTARQLVSLYPDRVSRETIQTAEKEPETKIECCQIVAPESSYKPDKPIGNRNLPFTVLYIEKTEEIILEETPEPWFRYVIPRWHMVDSPYARSPATEIVLPDAKTFQVVIRTLREAGEMHVNPPMAGFADALRSDVQLYPGGFTALDMEFDRTYKEAIGPLNSNPGAMPIGFEIAAALRDDIRLGFFIDKIKLPDINSKEMTAYEFQQRLLEYVRAQAPLFEPIEDEYNAPLCDLDFEILKHNGAFGNPEDMPEELNGSRVEFKFRSPLRDVQEAAMAGMFMDGMERVLGPAAQVDPAQMANAKMTTVVRDSLRGLGWPSTWFEDESAVEAAQAAMAKQRELAAGVEALQSGGAAAQAVGDGASSIQKVAG